MHSTGTLKHQAVSIILIEGAARILLSGVVLAAAFTRRRSFVGFSLLFLGTSMGSPLFALPFWGLGGYLIWRVFKYQKVLTARRGTSHATAGGRSAGGGRVPADVRAAGRAGATAARQRAQSPRRGRKEPTPTGPRPSKRYTPATDSTAPACSVLLSRSARPVAVDEKRGAQQPQDLLATSHQRARRRLLAQGP